MRRRKHCYSMWLMLHTVLYNTRMRIEVVTPFIAGAGAFRRAARAPGKKFAILNLHLRGAPQLIVFLQLSHTMSSPCIRRLQTQALSTAVRGASTGCWRSIVSPRCLSTVALRPSGVSSASLAQTWRPRRYQSGVAAAMYDCC